MKFKLVVAALLSPTFLLAQKVVDVSKGSAFEANTFYSVGGAPFVNAKFVKITAGSPFFKEEWMKASGTAASGVSYRGGLVKLNLYDNEIIFLDAAGNEMIVTSPLKEIILTDSVRNVSYHFENTLPLQSQGKKRWVQKLAGGKAGLYKAFQKSITDNASYGTATTEQTMNTIEILYLYYNGEVKQVKKPKDLTSLLTDKQSELTAYFNKSDFPKGNNEQQLVALITYYNSLQ